MITVCGVNKSLDVHVELYFWMVLPCRIYGRYVRAEVITPLRDRTIEGVVAQLYQGNTFEFGETPQVYCHFLVF